MLGFDIQVFKIASTDGERLIALLKEQIEKDFETIGISIQFTLAEFSYDSCYNNLLDAILWLLEKDPSKLMQLLYRIDVSDYSLKQRLLNNNNDFAHAITSLILEREAKKVWYRTNYAKIY